MIILGIETSCDETAASVIKASNAPRGAFIKVLSNIISSQIDIHKKYGGVIPELAAREHVLNILPVVNEALAKAGLKGKTNFKKPDAIAVTTGPGLITSLMVGTETAKTLSYAWKIPVISVNHIEAHIRASFINEKNKINFPAIALTVSGGHTMLVLMEKSDKFIPVGETRDDAAGEAFDKAAQLMGLGYPGGPAVSAEAERFQIINHKKQANSKFKIQNLKLISLPRPMINSGNFDFSFSGLKTALLYELQKDKDRQELIPEYAYEFQQAIIDVLISKTVKAAKKYRVRSVILSGGVAANKSLREQMEKKVKKELKNTVFTMPDIEYTTDNAAMVATAGYFKARKNQYTPWQKLRIDCNSRIGKN